jgi:hypothetical protein
LIFEEYIWNIKQECQSIHRGVRCATEIRKSIPNTALTTWHRSPNSATIS